VELWRRHGAVVLAAKDSSETDGSFADCVKAPTIKEPPEPTCQSGHWLLLQWIHSYCLP